MSDDTNTCGCGMTECPKCNPQGGDTQKCTACSGEPGEHTCGGGETPAADMPSAE